MVQVLKTVDDLNTLISSKAFVVVDASATWCGPCRMIAPYFERLAEANPDIAFAKFDVDDASDIATLLSISAMPTFIYFKDGAEVHRTQGASKDGIIKAITEHAGKAPNKVD
mmetsp:Transcript_13733/g.29526  ORF Transcript_13733/g.29526 Transcript_13733/m.29526 type:complete len:112 (+) Transcript_13733:133-468(+)|eukprot:CAMPEP_0202893240 /NCGR_PEP_ID=MMETSP1392-20130828/2848_1 /ASSEMBLY_ACC=CAM_ASM_000868 /TAXON_ID=225041 /ORGANISM="Chlamydomonas chlamydogama, Strain SAG 11-48b" /LENGTH=111 /DNA_ID=CAMNT_0049577493 /DNA_START=133 /DNA_END=468 /DNA_ORIENTATION=-